MSAPAKVVAAAPAGRRLLARPSIEVSVRQAKAPSLLAGAFAPGTEVFVTVLPGQDWRESVAMAAALSRAGFAPVPHVAARALESAEDAAAFLTACVREAGAASVLAIAGDLDAPRGPFDAVLDLVDSGLIERSGLTGVAFAGHPEGHPRVAADLLDRALVEKVDRAARRGLSPRIVTQFCFEAAPILAYLERLDRLGVAAPVRIGIAGPAEVKTLAAFAARCGVGNSLRTLRRSGGLFGRLLGYRGPDRLLRELAAGLPAAGAPVEGIHVFPFGGIARAAGWLADTRL